MPGHHGGNAPQSPNPSITERALRSSVPSRCGGSWPRGPVKEPSTARSSLSTASTASHPHCAPVTLGFLITCSFITVSVPSACAKLRGQAWVEYLPAYSPDCDPIEECISKLKALLRQLKARTQRTLGNALKYAIEQITRADIRGWFRHCGYTYSLN